MFEEAARNFLELQKTKRITLRVKNEDILKVKTKAKKGVLDIIGYSCKANSNEIILNWEHDDYKLLTKDEALKLDLSEDGKYFTKHFE